ncbi:MAG: RNA polymerase sigma factor [Oscillospiraceae bacterium]|nr:RNA polymerase sigma factor [Oscillospiraceae bacterium]
MIKTSLVHGEAQPSHIGYSSTFEEVYERQSFMVYRVCFSYMKNVADSEDMVADVFAKLIETNKTFQNVEHEKAWLLRIAINKCRNHFKHWWRSRADIDDYENLETVNPFQESELSQAILDLPERFKAVIYLYYYEGYSTAEVAGILKKPQSTILYHMREARKFLKGVLENEERQNS